MGTLILVLLVIAFYLLPTILVMRNNDKVSKTPTILLNVFFGWSIIGWFISLLMSVSKDPKSHIVINNNTENKSAE